MLSPRYQDQVERLISLSKAAAYSDLAREAEQVAKDKSQSDLTKGAALAHWGYSLLRIHPHKYHAKAADLIERAGGFLPRLRPEAPALVDGMMLIVGLSWQLLNDHPKALAAFQTILDKPDTDLTTTVKAGFSRAFSLHELNQTEEALATYRDLGQQLDAQPAGALTVSLRRDRARIRLNVADYLLVSGQWEQAEAELAQLQETDLTPLMEASKLVSLARIAVQRARWADAETLANRAYTAALEANYAPLRVDALGVLVTTAAIKGRREEQMRLVLEMASLAQAK